MLLTERELATYEGIQQALDKDRQDQMLRLMLADWYEERGREAAAECMRWLAIHNMWPYYAEKSIYWGWTRLGNNFKGYLHTRLPDEVHVYLPDYQGGTIQEVRRTQAYWWEFCQSRQFAEEAAVLAWEKWWQVR